MAKKQTRTKKAKPVENISANDQQEFEILRTIYNNYVLPGLQRRAGMMASGIEGTPGARDYDMEFGYPDYVDKYTYKRMYDRNPIANRVVKLYPQECWISTPTIYDYEEPRESPFEKEIADLNNDFNLFSYFKQLDVLAGIGAYGIMLLGIDDGLELSQPIPGVEEAMRTGELKQGKYKLLYLKVFPQTQVSISQVEKDPTNPRYSKPVMYSVSFDDPLNVDPENGDVNLTKQDVHWTRIIHFADNQETSSTIGTSRLQVVWNSILDHFKVTGSSGEMFFQGAYPGISFETTDDKNGNTKMDMPSLRKQVEMYYSGLQRYLGLQNTHANSLAPQAVDPKPHADVHLQAICIALACPLRVFTGAERGELASSQDSRNWNNRVMEREDNVLTPFVIRESLERLVYIGHLSMPYEGRFSVEWPDLNTQTELEKTEVALKKTQTLQTYVNGRVQTVIAPEDFLVRIMEMDSEEVDEMLDNAEEYEQETLVEEQKFETPLDQEVRRLEVLTSDDHVQQFGENNGQAKTQKTDTKKKGK